MSTAEMELPDPNKDHDIAVNPIGNDLVLMLCSCDWRYEAAKDFVDVIKNRHYGKYGLAKLT